MSLLRLEPESGQDYEMLCRYHPADPDRVKAAIAEEISRGLMEMGRALGGGADSIAIRPPLTREDIRAAHRAAEDELAPAVDAGWQSIANKMERETGEALPFGTPQERELLLDAYLDAGLTIKDGPSWGPLHQLFKPGSPPRNHGAARPQPINPL